MGVPASEVGYTSVTTGRGDHKVHKGHVVALEKKFISGFCPISTPWVKMFLASFGRVSLYNSLYFHALIFHSNLVKLTYSPISQFFVAGEHNTLGYIYIT
jgi:hypothetical protein